jgi:hypothetical protein
MMDLATFVGSVIAAALTLMTYSMLLGDQPIARLAEHIMVGAATAYEAIVAIEFIQRAGWMPIVAGKTYYVIALILGLMMFFRLNRSTAWLYKYPTAIVIATGFGVAIRSAITSQFLDQIRGTILPLTTPDAMTNINNLLVIIMTTTATVYFIFSHEMKGPFTTVSKIGRYTLLAAFGASFGATVQFRYEMVVGRLMFLLDPQIVMYSVLFLIIMGAALAYGYKTKKIQWY